MIRDVAQAAGAEVILVEVGGTVGDIESMPFLEALRELSYELGEGHMAFVHTTLVPVVGPVGEAKTKPTQHSVRELRAIGIRPNLIVARGPAPLTPEIKAKISLFCDVPPEAVISVPDQRVIYEVPLVLEAQGVGQLLSRILGLPDRVPDYTSWKEFLATYRRNEGSLDIAVVGKYTELRDAYLSHTEAFNHVQGHLGREIRLHWYDAEDIPTNPGLLGRVERSDALLVPGGFGARGVEGKVQAIEVARQHGDPVPRRLLRVPDGGRRVGPGAIPACRGRTPPRSTLPPPTRSSACSKGKRASGSSAARCASARNACS